MSKYDEYLAKLKDFAERKAEISRATAALYRQARRDGVSVDDLKAAMKENFFLLTDRSAQISS